MPGRGPSLPSEKGIFLIPGRGTVQDNIRILTGSCTGFYQSCRVLDRIQDYSCRNVNRILYSRSRDVCRISKVGVS